MTGNPSNASAAPIEESPADTMAQFTEAVQSGIAAHQAGDIDGAEALYRRALELQPDHPHAIHFLGVIHHQRGDNQKAMELIEQAIKGIPDHADCHSNLGAVNFALGRVEQAAKNFRRATELNPAGAEAHSNLGTALCNLGQIDDAITSHKAAVRGGPGVAKFIKRLADLYLEHDQPDDAVEYFRRYLDLSPGDAEAQSNLGYAYEVLERLEDAEAQYRLAYELLSDSPEIANNIGGILTRLGRGEEADEFFELALAMDPGKWEDLANLAGTYINRRLTERSLPIYRQLLKLHPDNPKVHNDYGVALSLMGKTLEGLAEFRHAIELDPEHVQAYNNVAGNLIILKDRVGAIEMLKKALDLDPKAVHPHINIALALYQENRYDEAYLRTHALILLEDYRTTMFANPSKVFRMVCAYDDLIDLGDPWELMDGVRVLDSSATFLELLVVTRTEDEIERAVGYHKAWAKETARQEKENRLPPIERKRTGKKIRFAFLSSDLRSHSVAAFVRPILERYDRERFEVYCYSPFEDKTDPVQAKIKGMVDEFRFIENVSDLEFAQRIRDDEIDILYDLNGYTRDSKMKVMIHRPAPVQITWLGYPFTTGVSEYDYFQLDPDIRPEKDEWLAETPLVLPETWACFGELPNEPLDERPPCLRDGRITFGTMNNPYKFTREIIELWARIMHRVPNSRFLVVRPECTSMIFCTNIAAEFEKFGIGSDRVYLVSNKMYRMSNLGYYAEMDISLDTFPVTGGNTTCDSLWMGVPVVSLYGPSIHQRVSYGIMKKAGFEEICTRSPDEYVEFAVALAQDTDTLVNFRRIARPSLLDSPLCQADRYVTNLQNTFEELVERHELR